MPDFICTRIPLEIWGKDEDDARKNLFAFLDDPTRIFDEANWKIERKENDGGRENRRKASQGTHEKVQNT